MHNLTTCQILVCNSWPVFCLSSWLAVCLPVCFSVYQPLCLYVLSTLNPRLPIDSPAYFRTSISVCLSLISRKKFLNSRRWTDNYFHLVKLTLSSPVAVSTYVSRNLLNSNSILFILTKSFIFDWLMQWRSASLLSVYITHLFSIFIRFATLFICMNEVFHILITWSGWFDAVYVYEISVESGM